MIADINKFYLSVLLIIFGIFFVVVSFTLNIYLMIFFGSLSLILIYMLHKKPPVTGKWIKKYAYFPTKVEDKIIWFTYYEIQYCYSYTWQTFLKYKKLIT